MVFKINVSHNGKTAKFETENEELVGKSIGDKIAGKMIGVGLEGYELEITGTSDKAGFAGLPDESGPGLRRVLLTYGRGLHKRPKGIKKKGDKPSGLRYRKTVRGNEISEDTIQINIKVLKEGGKEFEDLVVKKEEVKESETPKEEAKAEVKEIEKEKVGDEGVKAEVAPAVERERKTEDSSSSTEGSEERKEETPKEEKKKESQ